MFQYTPFPNPQRTFSPVVGWTAPHSVGNATVCSISGTNEVSSASPLNSAHRLDGHGSPPLLFAWEAKLVVLSLVVQTPSACGGRCLHLQLSRAPSGTFRGNLSAELVRRAPKAHARGNRILQREPAFTWGRLSVGPHVRILASRPR